MLPMNRAVAGPRAGREVAARGAGPALIGGWIGGTLLAMLVLWGGAGWIAALAAYSLGGALCLAVLAVAPIVDLHLPAPALRPVFVRVRRGARLRP